MSTGWSQADSQIQSTLWLQAHRAWLCRHSRMPWSPGRVGRGPKTLVKTASRQRPCSPAWGLLPVPGSPPREGLVAELSSQPRWGLWHWAPAAAPGAVPSVPRVTQVGLDCEGNSAMSSPEASPAWPASTPGCSPPLLQSRSDGEGAGQDLGLLPHHPPPTLPF